jgi:protoporphyrinogen oxidase
MGAGTLVYLSKYLPKSAQLYRMSNEDAVEIAVGALTRMFPDFRRNIIENAHVWRAD